MKILRISFFLFLLLNIIDICLYFNVPWETRRDYNVFVRVTPGAGIYMYTRYKGASPSTPVDTVYVGTKQ